MLLDTNQLGHYYGKLTSSKGRDFYERFDPFILDKRPAVGELMSRTFDRLFPEKAPVFLDVGCGTGFYFPLLRKHAENLIGAELCQPLLAQAKEMVDRKNLTNCRLLQASAHELPLEDNKVDVVLSWDFLHHVPDVDRAVSEIARVLKPGGRYVVVEPNILNLSILYYHLRRRAEWGLLSKNQFTNAPVISREFDVSVSYDNTVISYINERTLMLWKAVNAFTSVRPFRYLSFRYIIEGIKSPSVGA